MSGLEFVADLIGSLAWPLVALAIAITFRRQLTGILERPSGTLEAGPVKAAWGPHEIAEVAAEAEVIAAAIPDTDAPGGTECPIRPSELFANLVETAPGQAVIQTVDLIDDMLRQKLEEQGVLPPPAAPRSTAFLAAYASSSGLMGEDMARLIVMLASFRERIRHGGARAEPDPIHLKVDAIETTTVLKVADIIIETIAAIGP